MTSSEIAFNGECPPGWVVMNRQKYLLQHMIPWRKKWIKPNRIVSGFKGSCLLLIIDHDMMDGNKIVSRISASSLSWYYAPTAKECKENSIEQIRYLSIPNNT